MNPDQSIHAFENLLFHSLNRYETADLEDTREALNTVIRLGTCRLLP
jgi:hypothetical protein